MIHRPPLKYKPWQEAEVEILRQHYAMATKEDLLTKLPNRTWVSIRDKAVSLGLVRNDKAKDIGRNGKAYSEEEDKLIRRFYKGEISQDEIVEKTGRKLSNIRVRARKLGLKYRPPKATWEWLGDNRKTESESPSRQKCLRRSEPPHGGLNEGT